MTHFPFGHLLSLFSSDGTFVDEVLDFIFAAGDCPEGAFCALLALFTGAAAFIWADWSGMVCSPTLAVPDFSPGFLVVTLVAAAWRGEL